jgi:hypothetical protein
LLGGGVSNALGGGLKGLVSGGLRSGAGKFFGGVGKEASTSAAASRACSAAVVFVISRPPGSATSGVPPPTLARRSREHSRAAATASHPRLACCSLAAQPRLSAQGRTNTVVAVDSYHGAEDMRDLTVADTHTYYVLAGDQPVLVHNVDEAEICRLTLGAGPHAKAGVATTKTKVTQQDPEYQINQENGNAHGCHTCGEMTPATRTGNWVFDHQPPVSIGPKPYYGTGYPQCGRTACQPRQGGITSQLSQENYDFPPE